MAAKKGKVDENAEARINFMYAMEAASKTGDTKALAKAKKDSPKEYAAWEAKHGKTSAPVKKTGKK